MRGFRNALGALAHGYNPIPEFTTLTDSFKGALDHIFIAGDRLVATAALEM
jgi:mRNA deadenylase 3'-5' endonuclease subunit Ccr4